MRRNTYEKTTKKAAKDDGRPRPGLEMADAGSQRLLLVGQRWSG